MSGAGQRVFLVDGQAVYLEGDGEITEDVLQQALAQLAAGGAQTAEQPETEPESEQQQPEQESEQDQTMESEDGIVVAPDDGGEEEEGVLAILQDESGQQQTVRLTPDQAAALGIDYQQLLAAAAAAGGDESDATQGEAAAPSPAPAEQSSAQEVASLTSSVVLDLNESQPSLVNQSEGGDKVTYTFEVVDKDGASSEQPQEQESTGLLAKSRDIMVPRVKTGVTQQMRQQIHKTAAQVLHTTTPAAPVPRDPVTGGYISSSTLKKGPVYNTGPAGVQQSKRKTVINTANTVQQKTSQSSAAPSMPTVGATAVPGDPSATDMDEDVDDLPVILTPVNGSEKLPDFIEPRPGLKILVRPLESASGTGSGGGGDAAPSRAVGSSENPIQLVQQGNTFKSLQPLSCEQLKQIATVLQQSRLNVPSNSKNSLYDADTNTRIVYRVVYPEDVARGGRGAYRAKRGRPRGRGNYRGGYRRAADDDDADWSPELNKYEKAEKKRLSTKTRTGRVSKPPKHMVKDYRRIHRLDFNEPDLDDSDGGYSEYAAADGDATRDSAEFSNDAPAAGAAGPRDAGPPEPEPEPEEPPAPRPKRPVPQAMRDRFTCRTCNALCIGYIRLEGHFAKYPDHERPVYVPPKTLMNKPPGRPGGYRPLGRPRGRPRGRGRGYYGRGAYLSDPPSAKRPRLDEADLPPTSADQLFSQLVSQAGGSVDRLCDTMAAVLEEFRRHVRTAVTPAPAAERPIGTSAGTGADGPVLKIDEERAALTGLPSGTYVLWPTTEAADDAGESMSGDVGEAASESSAAAEQAATASPSAATALSEAVMEALSAEHSPAPATATEQSEPAAAMEQEPAEAVEESEQPPLPKESSSSPPVESESEPERALKSEPASPPVEKAVLSAAEISQVALSAAEGTQMPPPADPAPPPVTNGSETETGHRGVSDVLDEFVDGLVDASDLTFTGEPVSDIDSEQIQIKMVDSDAAATAGDMPLLEDER